MKQAIAVLTRGYPTLEPYHTLIQRNRAIFNVFYSRLKESETADYDILVFHEGNISPAQQAYIQAQTPDLPLQFVTVPFVRHPPKDNPCCPRTLLSSHFSQGYKNMCAFWSIWFLHFFSPYEYVIRIDEDCLLRNMDPTLVNQYRDNRIVFGSPHYQIQDEPDVTLGLEALCTSCLRDMGKKAYRRAKRFPYTNVMIVNVPFFLRHAGVNEVLRRIRRSGCIFNNRWGDLPIWGYLLNHWVHPAHYRKDPSIQYYHGSHDTVVNEHKTLP